MVPACSVYNYGTASENYSVRMKIGSGYDNTASVSGHAAGGYLYVTFPSWTALARGTVALSCSTELAVDGNRANDRVTGGVDVAVHDIAALAIIAPAGTIGPGSVTPQASVHNSGTARENCDVTFSINAVPPYSQTVNLPAGLPFADTVIDFPSWTASTGSYTARCTVALVSDQIADNNTVSAQFAVGEVDVGVTAVLTPTGTHDTGDVLVPSASVKNFGEFPAGFKTFFGMDKGTDSLVYSESIAVTGLSAGTETTLVFTAWSFPHPVGTYTTRCSTFLVGDGNPANDAMGGSFIIRTSGGGSGDTGWVRLTDLPAGPKSKRVKDGGCLTYSDGTYKTDTTYLYALKGNGRCEYYRYSITANTWEAKESIPAIGSSGKKKAVKKGATIATADGMQYAAKGNNTLEWWQYDPAKSGTPTYPWTQMTDIPTGAKFVKEGTGAATVQIGDTSYIYFLRGSSGQDFLRYNTSNKTWQAMTPAPSGVSGKSYKDGSCLTVNNNGTVIYALKGSYNEFYSYDVATNTWTTLTSLPLTGSAGKKKKAKSGAGLAFHAGYAYVLKGNNTEEFWSYQADSSRWTQRQDIPAGSGKRVKGGGALTAANDKLFAFKGNNTLDFFKYGLSAYGLQLTANGLPAQDNLQSAFRNPQSELGISLRLSASICGSSSPIRIDYTLPRAGNATIKLYDITGQFITTLAEGYHTAGTSSLRLSPSSLPSGIYLLKLTTETMTATTKLIIE
jgi:N-acetylneuraminic acid mutarotase